MPVLDMPVEKLLQYQGISPCPADIDEYWDEALAEMNSLDPKAEFIKNGFPSKYTDMYDLYYMGTKNARIHAKVAVPNNVDGKMPAVLMFHGLSGSACEWQGLLNFAAQGYVVAFMDVRGQGGYSEDVGGVAGTTFSNPFIRGIDGDKHDLLMRDVYLDTALLAKIIMNMDCVDEKRVATTGGSQGGCLCIACACLVPEIAKCAASYPYLSDFKRVYEMDLNKDAYEGLKYYFRHYDPNHEREDEIFERLGYIDLQNIAKRMRAEFRMYTGLVDTICPPSTQFAIYNKVTSKKDVVLYPEFGHEWLQGSNDKIFEFLSDL
ncbi:MAG: acetylxylan esterase [Eubacteriales bacterium]|nr:acetylxylan esterase [Eubacteriales bacterium]